MQNLSKQRCSWVPPDDEIYTKYHDEEWGNPIYDDNKIFEFLTLETFQAGLSWKTVLYKRENFRNAFDYFDPTIIATYKEKKVTELMNNTGIIRNKLKILATINNAKEFLNVQKEFGAFSKYMWGWSDNVAWAKDLKKRNFKFLGPTVVYAHMQATGMVNDHDPNCFRKNA